MSIVHLSRELHGRSVVSVTNGQIIAKVEDVLIDPAARRVAAVITSKGGLLKREQGIEVIPGEAVQVWGRDVILVKEVEVIVKKTELPGSEKWLVVSTQIKGHDVVGADGTRIGQLNDVVIDAGGQLVAYSLAKVLIAGPVAKSKRIAAKATRVLGGDVLIVEPTEMVEPPEVVEPTEMAEPGEPAEAGEPSEVADTVEDPVRAETEEPAERVDATGAV